MTGPDPTPAVDPDILAVRRDESGRPHLSVTFLLGRTPAPHEPIGDLVLSATVSVGLVSRLDDLAWVGFTLEVATPVLAESRGPFGTAALATTLAGEEARRLLTALAAGHGGPTLELQARRTDGHTGHWLFDLAEVLAPALAPDPTPFVHLVTVEGGVVGDVFPARPASRSRGPVNPGPMLMSAKVITPIAQLVRPKPSGRPGMITAVAIDHQIMKEQLLAIHVDPAEKGPILGSQPPSPELLLGDRSGDQRWYLPEVTLVSPVAGVQAGASPFRFDLVTAGHQPDGTPGLEATVVVTLAARPSEATLKAWEQAGQPPLAPLPCQVQVGLGIPFRDGQGRAQVETVTATSVVSSGTFGEQGSTMQATFILANSWARMAYGSLSTPGFQSSPPVVQVSISYAGWQSQGTAFPKHLLDLVATNKFVALRQAGQPTRPMAKTQLMSLAKAGIQLKPSVTVEGIKTGVITWSWVQRTTTTEIPIVMACAEHGQLYRQATTTGWVAIGCQPALNLGQAEYRTWQAETVSSVTGVRVFRSLTQPGRFLVVPDRYGIGRHPASDPERAMRATLLLTSTIDIDNPATILCVLAAALEPETNAGEFALLAEELRQRTNRDVELLSPAQAGLSPDVSWAISDVRSLDTLPIDTGFTVVISMGVPGFLALKTLMKIGSVVGSARYRLPGGIEFASTLRLDLGNVLGPVEGPVRATDSGGGQVELRNQLDRAVAVHRIIGNGVVVASPEQVLDPLTSAVFSVPAGSSGPYSVDHTVAPGTESLDETRSYIEDLQLGVTFMATGSFSGIAGLEIACQFLGDNDEVFTLTEGQRSRERDFVLPLTAYASDPALTFTVTAVATDGTRSSAAPLTWPVRSRGVLIPIDTPPQTP